MNLQEKDRAYLWHPYTQEKTAGDNIVMVRGEGAHLYDEAGNKYIDACASWWTNLHGHAHPYIAKKIGEQALELEQVIFAGFSHPAAIALAEKLLDILPEGFAKVFYSDNGSTAVEAAIKMALQYRHNKGEERTKIICFRDAYHGDTFGSMSVSARGVFTEPYTRLLFDVIFIDTPDPENEFHVIEQFRKALIMHKTEIAAFLFEPLVLGSIGMKMYNASLLDQLLAICAENDILTIADEVMTGFGRTGRMFAIEYLKHTPDIICLSKGITGGFMPFAATITRQFIYDAFYADEKYKMFFHGHSYTGNPLGCSAALASLEVFKNENTLNKIASIVSSHQSFADKIRANRAIKDVRQCGTILAMEFKTDAADGYLNNIRDRMYSYFISKRIMLRPLGNVLYILPPYCISQADLSEIYQAIEDFTADIL
jgi:adenosylmethionine-8-amino-7-oxononanoate aminotransferase